MQFFDKLIGKIFPSYLKNEIQNVPLKKGSILTVKETGELLYFDGNSLISISERASIYDWNNERTYSNGDIVKYLDKLYISNDDNNINNQPGSSNSWNSYNSLPDGTTYKNMLVWNESTGEWETITFDSILGSWDSNYTYNIDEVCSYQGDLYKSLTDSNTNNTPDTSATNWQKITSIKELPDGTTYKNMFVWNESTGEWETIEFNSILGSWDSNYTYNTDEVCSYQGDLYKSLTDSNTNNTPDTSATNWQKITSTDGGTGNVPDGVNRYDMIRWDDTSSEWKSDISISNFVGEWKSDYQYTVNDVCVRNGKKFECKFDSINKDPLTQTAYWKLIEIADYDNQISYEFRTICKYYNNFYYRKNYNIGQVNKPPSMSSYWGKIGITPKSLSVNVDEGEEKPMYDVGDWFYMYQEDEDTFIADSCEYDTDNIIKIKFYSVVDAQKFKKGDIFYVNEFDNPENNGNFQVIDQGNPDNYYIRIINKARNDSSLDENKTCYNVKLKHRPLFKVLEYPQVSDSTPDDQLPGKFFYFHIPGNVEDTYINIRLNIYYLIKDRQTSCSNDQGVSFKIYGNLIQSNIAYSDEFHNDIFTDLGSVVGTIADDGSHDTEKGYHLASGTLNIAPRNNSILYLSVNREYGDENYYCYKAPIYVTRLEIIYY